MTPDRSSLESHVNLRLSGPGLGSSEPHEPIQSGEPVLRVQNLHTYFPTKLGPAKAVNGVSFQISASEILGLVGETGSGKSITAASIIGLVPPPGRIVKGAILYKNKDLTQLPESEVNRIRGAKISLVVQNVRASLNPLITVGHQMNNVWAAHLHRRGKRATAYTLEMLRAVGFNDPQRVANSYPHQLSGGMAQRVVIAIAIGPSPDLVIADEPTTGLDATVQMEILDLMQRMLSEARASALLITHDLGIVANYCTRVAVMHAGQIVEEASAAAFFARAMHPYSVSLIQSLPNAKPFSRPLEVLGPAPNLTDLPSGCHYRTRCPLAVAVCEKIEPGLRSPEPSHAVRCHRAEEVPELTRADTP